MASPVHREAPPLAEATLWYGPFPLRFGPALLLLAIAFVLALNAIDEERSALRSLECTRPGRCLVRRGSDLWGVRDAEIFDPARIVRAEVRRSGGKTPSHTLYLVDDRGRDLPLARGSAARALLPSIEPFFSEPRRTTLSIRRDPDLDARVISFGSVLVSLALAAGLLLRAARRTGHYRVSIEPTLVRVERLVLGVPRFARSVPLEWVSSVYVERGPSSTERVVLGTREGLDFPIVERFMPSGVAHGELADRLREELRLKPDR